MARTQQQRREETVSRLLDASIDTIVEVGYARASAKVIAKRAEVSDGALFRHFPTMGDLMGATAHEALRRQLDSFTKQVTEIPSNQPALPAVLTILRDLTGNAISAVAHELFIAARTDEKLRTTLQEVMATYVENIHDVAMALPEADGYPADEVAAIVATFINAFDGAALVRAVMPSSDISSDIEEKRIRLLSSLLEGPRKK
jgi:AcrR family transcriptional regulator